MKKVIRKGLMVGGLLMMLVQPIQAYREVNLEDAISMHPSLLTGVGFGVFSDEFPVPVIGLMYDQDRDGNEDARFVYFNNSKEAGNISEIGDLIQYMIDWNRNGQYDDHEIYMINYGDAQ